jgi:hypothetical protein
MIFLFLFSQEEEEPSFDDSIQVPHSQVVLLKCNDCLSMAVFLQGMSVRPWFDVVVKDRFELHVFILLLFLFFRFRRTNFPSLRQGFHHFLKLPFNSTSSPPQLLPSQTASATSHLKSTTDLIPSSYSFLSTQAQLNTSSLPYYYISPQPPSSLAFVNTPFFSIRTHTLVIRNPTLLPLPFSFLFFLPGKEYYEGKQVLL